MKYDACLLAANTGLTFHFTPHTGGAQAHAGEQQGGIRMAANTPTVADRGIHLLRDPMFIVAVSQLYKPEYQTPASKAAGAGRA